MSFDDALMPYAEEPLTRQLMKSLLKDYKRPNDKIGELLKAGELTSIKNGLYIPGVQSKVSKPESFLIANHLWGPSYISFESALAHWGYIPERVYEISSVTIKISKKYKTPAGRFTYKHAELPYYSFGITNVLLTPKQRVFIATPEKAICDKITMTAGVQLRSPMQVLAFLIEDMRIDQDKLRTLNLEQIASWTSAALKKDSLKMLIKTLQNL